MSESNWQVEVLLAGNWRAATTVLVSNEQHHLIVDTGMPHQASKLISALEQRGLKPKDIRMVVNTHYHIDHVLNNSLFPSSVIYATQQAYDWSSSLYSDLRDDLNWEKLILKYYPETFEYERARELMATLRKLALRWWDPKRLGDASQFRWIEKDPLPEGFEPLTTSGHVPGHLSLLIETAQSGPLTVIAGDALLCRDQNAPVLTMIPHNRNQFERDRAQILAKSGRILPGHDQEFSLPPRPGLEGPPAAPEHPKGA